MNKRTLLYGVVIMILLAVALMAGRQSDNDSLLLNYSDQISSWLTEQDATAKFQIDPAQESAAFTVIHHHGDSIVRYSNTKALPGPGTLKKIGAQPGRSLVRLPMGWYLAKVENAGELTHTILIPIRYSLDFIPGEGNTVFPADRNIPAQLQIGDQKTAYPVKAGAVEIAWLEASGSLQTGWISGVQLGAWLLIFSLLLRLLWAAGIWLNGRFGAWSGAALQALAAAGWTLFNQQTGWLNSEFGALELFRPAFDGATLIGNSVGDWLIHVSLLFFFMAFFHQSFRAKSLDRAPAGLRFGIAAVSYGLIALAVPLCILVMQQLSFNNRLGFDFDNVLSIGTAGFLSLTGLIALMAGLFLFGHRLMLTVRGLGLGRVQRGIAMGIGLLVVAASASFWGISPLDIFLFGAGYVVAMDLFGHWEGNGFGWLVVWLLLFSLFAAAFLRRNNTLNDQQRRLEYARALVEERDTAVAEPMLLQLGTALIRDSAAIGRSIKPWPFKAHLEILRTQVNALVLEQPYLFQHYRLNIAAFDEEHQPVLIGQTLGYQEVVQDYWEHAQPVKGKQEIRYVTGADGKFRYLLRLTTGRAEDAGQQVSTYVVLEHIFPAPALAYTQIFYNSPYKGLDHLSNYSFAVQKNGRILVELGRGSIPALGSAPAKGMVTEVEGQSPRRIDAVATGADGISVAAVGRPLGGWLKLLYLFSILFTLAALWLMALAFANSWLNFLPEEYDFRLTARGSLARRIHLWNVSLLAVSFLVVGYLTYRHFTDTAHETEMKALDYRVEALQNGLEAPYLTASDSSLEKESGLIQSIQRITTSLNVDANFFSKTGELLFSTQKDLVSLGILPSKMNVAAQNALLNKSAQETETIEQNGGNAYRCKYRPCRDGRGDLLGFVGVPYLSSQDKIGADVSDFIGILASLYVFLLLLAYAITYALSRSIIRPLSLLSEKVQELKLEDKNAPLEYAGDAQDEISELIGQYNTMVDKLEASKIQLVRLEREGAWREMAKQVAHDIKNPLTTMKLSMQQLERVSNNPEQAAAYLRKAITRLIEQIDSLAQIASEFSMFANLDIRQKSDVVINEVVESVHDLFSEQKNVGLELNLPKDRYHILGDKNHLIRVFNNLVINAIQAIPSDRQGHVKVSLSADKNMSVVKISDNGGGIPPEIGERVFEPNFTTKTSGSGLGLAICKKIIEAHDGTIRFETRENEGTDFFVEIPVTALG